MKPRSWFAVLFVLAGLPAQDTRPVGPQADGAVIVPTHQMLRPAGHQVAFPGRPTDLLLLDRGRTLAVKGKSDLILISTADRVIRQSLAVPKRGLSFHGLAASPDERRIFVTGSHDTLWVAELRDGIARWERPLPLPGPAGRGFSAPGGIAVKDAQTLFVTLSRNNSLGEISLERWALVREIPVGVAPYGVVIWKGFACVSNWGGRHPSKGEITDTSSGTRVVVDPRTNTAASGSVSLVDLAKGEEVAQIDVELHPSSLALDTARDWLYVANANSDSVSIIDLVKRSVAATLSVRPAADLPFGSSPTALALSPDGGRLFVANGTNNAVGVFDTEKLKPLGFLPVGWYPGGLALDAKRGWLHVANTKGEGSRHPPTGRAGFNSHNHLGSVSIVTDLGVEALAAGTDTVALTNRHQDLERALLAPRPEARPVPVPERHGEPSVFEHVLYIIKENRIPLDRLNVRLDRLRGPARRDALASLELDLDEIDQADENTFNRILWHAMKGHDVPYPEHHTRNARGH